MSWYIFEYLAKRFGNSGVYSILAEDADGIWVYELDGSLLDRQAQTVPGLIVWSKRSTNSFDTSTCRDWSMVKVTGLGTATDGVSIPGFRMPQGLSPGQISGVPHALLW